MRSPSLAATSGALRNLLSNAWVRYILALLAGVLLALAFPQSGIAGFAWGAPALMIAATGRSRGWETLRIGYVAGLAFWLTSLYWVTLIPASWFPILGWVALSAYLALFPATWVWLIAGVTPENVRSADRISIGNWSQRTHWALSGAAAWVALEMIRARLIGGFPWDIIGVSQYRLTPLIQIASVTGVYGISFLIVWTSLSLLNAVRVILVEPSRRLAWQMEIFLPFVVVAALFVHGFMNLGDEKIESPTLRVTFIQPSIPQTMIWDTGENDQRFAQLLQLTETALTNETDLLLWPEAALPEFDSASYDAITNRIQRHQVWMIFGADDVVPKLNGNDETGNDFFNAAFLFNPTGHFSAAYHKQKLVIFGEYIPFENWLPFVKWFTPVTGSYAAGDKPVPFEMEVRGEGLREHEIDASNEVSTASRSRSVKTATLICFEDIFPQLAPAYVDDDTDFLVNLTNDGWFGESSQQWQHMANAVFRTVENGVPLLRCCNNGISCWIDSLGRIRQVFHDESGSVYGAGSMTLQIPLLSSIGPRTRTFYSRHGDWFGWGCVAVTAITIVRFKIAIRKQASDRVIDASWDR